MKVWLLWLAIALALTLRAFLWQIQYFKNPGEAYYRLVIALLAIAPLLLTAYQFLRRRWAWRYELATIAAIPIAAALLYEPRAAAIVIVVFLACHAAGNAVRKRLRLDPAGAAEQIAMGAGIGFGLLFCLLFVLGMAGLYFAPVFGVLIALPCVLLWKEHAELWNCIVRCHAAWCSTTRLSEALGAILVAFTAIFTVMATMVALAPSLAYDVLWMHLPSAQYYAAQHAVRPVPGLDYSYYPQSVETLMTMGYMLAGQAAAQLLPPVFFVLTLLILFQLVRHAGADAFSPETSQRPIPAAPICPSFHPRFAAGCPAASGSAFAAVVLAAAVPAFHWTGSVAKNDYAMVFFILAALSCWVRWRESANFRWIQLGVFFLAIAAGVKHIVLFALPGLAALYLYAVWQERRRVRALATLALIFAVFGLFWHARTFLLTGNPVFPERLGRVISGAVKYSGSGPAWKVKALRYVSLPWNLQFAGDRYFESPLNSPLGIFFVFFAPVWWFTRRHRPNTTERACLLFAVAFLVYWSMSIANIRYAIAPLLVLFALTARRTLLFRCAIGAPIAYTLLFALCGSMILEINGPQLRYFAGRSDREAYLRDALATYRSLEFLRSRWMPGDTVLGVGNCSAAYAPSSTGLDCMNPRDDVRAALSRGTYRYLILPRGPLEQSVMGPAAPLYTDASFAVYALPAFRDAPSPCSLPTGQPCR